MKGLKVLFLSSDTGGGHRASAESLGRQFQIHYPGSSYTLLDVVSEDGCQPYKKLVPAYQHLSQHPRRWNLLYHISNSRPLDFFSSAYFDYMCEERIRKRIRSHDPDVVISVHPLMNGAPQAACRRISAENGRPLPFFTVVTDLGSAHCTWFSKKVEKMFIASEKIRRIAKARGRVPDEKLILSGLPIRHEFAVRAKRLGDRTTDGGRRYQRSVRLALDLPCEGKIVLLMGGGEGVSLENIPTALFSQFCQDRINVTIIVICGRNARLRQRLLDCDWDSVRSGLLKFPARTFFPSSLFVPAKISAGGAGAASNTTEAFKESRAEISVLPLGFVTNIDAYMVASDVLISKAGPGTIAEAAAVGLPIMLTRFVTSCRY
mmetsp:Transcript_14511/g.31909  ORF Transcript_14511/g.31909 Transcript_14511/m.31909 type:complete len:376 (-) Transcript_14511:458-1585(-)